MLNIINVSAASSHPWGKKFLQSNYVCVGTFHHQYVAPLL